MMTQIKLEFLPNEILFQCFNYLNIIDIYYSFDQLNHRFNSLIRTIPFDLNFTNIKNKYQCDEFCQKLSTDETIQNQLYSLYLSNENTCYPIHLFLSKCSLLQFPHLHSLTLHKIRQNSWKSIRSVLSLIPKLSSFQMIDFRILLDVEFSVLPILQLNTLIIPAQPLPGSIFDIEFSCIMHLSINSCKLNDLLILFKNAPKLNHFKTDYLRTNNTDVTTNISDYINSHANNLKTLHIHHIDCSVSNLFTLLKRTPNLKNLILLESSDVNIINANAWQTLITSSLSHLKNFKFNFYVDVFPHPNLINEQNFKEFRNDFWCKEHYWHTEYTIRSSSASIYTIPHPCDSFGFHHCGQRYHSEAITHTHTFNSVKDLLLRPEDLTENNEYYFANIDLLSLGEPYIYQNEYIEINYSHLKHLQTMVNLSHIKHLILLSNLKFETSNILKEIVKSTTQLTSLSIDYSLLQPCLNDDELCNYLNRTIKKLNIRDDPLKISDQLKHFCKVFSNLEQLKYDTNESNILFLTKHLLKLKYMEIQVFLSSNQRYWINEEVEKLPIDTTIDFKDHGNNFFSLFIWIYRK
ncbi:unnamed protein product [Adineta ricciae]|uniref:F-box domain-containing protein n=1 Tax=Adineta ricciae TaxID=249248 RepID=A0A814M7U2_ADIRI|nr:unnamed protein product [Adineta ricciae]CAF1487561.1 unnamed protein product [Adineta ricciae]